MRGLKSLVIIMGIAILVAATVVVMTIIQRAVNLAPPAETKAIQLPPGATVVGQDISDKRILLRIRLPTGEERLIIVDADTGAVNRTFTLQGGDGAK